MGLHPLPEAKRADGLEKVTGRACFVTDVQLPGMAYACLVTGKGAQGAIKAVRSDQARNKEGVIGIFTARDLQPLRMSRHADGVPLLAESVVRFDGEPVCAVVAVTPALAAEAAGAIEVEYESTAGVRGRPDQGTLDDGGSAKEFRFEIGDPAGVMERVAHLFEHEFAFPRRPWVNLEPPGVLARLTGRQIEVWTNSSTPFAIQRQLAALFRVASRDVRVVVPYVGGSFCSRVGGTVEALAVALSGLAGRSVYVAVPPGYGVVGPGLTIKLITGLDGENRLLARRVDVEVDGRVLGGDEPDWKMLVLPALGPYACPNVSLHTSSRGSSSILLSDVQEALAPFLTWAVESQIDRICADLGVNPITFRRTNLLTPKAPVTEGARPLDVDAHQLLDEVTQRLSRRALPEIPGAGQGFAIGLASGGGPNPYGAVAYARLHHDGTATLSAGAVERGQGIKTALRFIFATTLGIPPGSVRVELADTQLTPYDEGGAIGRATSVCGWAAQQAAVRLRHQIIMVVAELWGASEDAVALSNGFVTFGERTARLDELLALYFGSRGGDLVAKGYARDGWPPDGANAPLFWALGASGASVEVDVQTGIVKACYLVTAANVGRVLLRAVSESRMEGAAMIGLADLFWGESMAQASEAIERVPPVPTFGDSPALEVVLVEDGQGPGPFGIRGISPACRLSVGAALASAVRQATGVFVMPPLTPERVWRAMNREERIGP